MIKSTCQLLLLDGYQRPRVNMNLERAKTLFLAVPSLSWLYQRKSESKSTIWFFLGEGSAGQTPVYDCEGTSTVLELHNPRLLRLLEPASKLRLNSALFTSGTGLFTSNQYTTCITTLTRLALDVASLLHLFVSVWKRMKGCKRENVIIAAQCLCESCSRLPSTYLVNAKAWKPCIFRST